MQHLFSVLQQVDSTNNYAMAAIRNGDALDGSCYFTMHQTQGKGQRGKVWESQANENIAMSIITKTKPIFSHNIFILNALVAVALRRFCELSTSHEGFTIKWPNDIYYGDKKAAGILIENIISNSVTAQSVIGIGINVNQSSFPDHLPNAISLSIVSEITFDIEDLAKKLHQDILQAFLLESEEDIIDEYNLHLYKKNQETKLRYKNASFLTTIKYVTSYGQLITNDVMERIFSFGEVVWE